MKKLLPLAIIAIFGALTLTTSCTKKSDPTGNYTCTCTITVSGFTDTASTPLTGVTKGTATSDCNKIQTTYNSSGTGTTASCHL